MHLVVEHAQMQPFFVLDENTLKPGVCCDSRQCVHLQMEDHVNGMTGDDPMDRNGPKIHCVLNRVHRQARPRTDVCIPMVKGVCGAVKPRNVQGAMDPVKLNDYRLTPVGSLFECNSRY
jgi:hypothetical protein